MQRIVEPITMEIQPEDLEADLPTAAELEHFARLGQLGRFSEAKSYFRDNLRMYTDVFPVVAENATFLLDQNLYGELREFLSMFLTQEEPHGCSSESSDIASSFNSNELNLLELLHSFCVLYTEGSMRQTLDTMRRVKKQCSTAMNPISPQGKQDPTSRKLPEVPKVDDTEIQIFLTCVRIAMVAATQSNWVTLEDFQLPWTGSLDPQEIWLDIEKWCLNLALEGRTEATDLLRLLLQGYLNPGCLPRKPETAKEYAEAFSKGDTAQDVGTEHSSFFKQFIETVGDCQFDEGKLLLRFAAHEAYCSLLQDRRQMEMAAELLDPMKSDFDLLSQWVPEMKFSRQYIQWGFLQNALLGQYNGFNTTPMLEELLPVAERLSDYPMKQKLLEQLAKENRAQIMVRDYWFSETSFFRYMRLSEIILEKRIQSVLKLAELVCYEYDIIEDMSKDKKPEAAAEFRERCTSVLEQLQTDYPELDAPLIRRTIGRILGQNFEGIENDVPLYVQKIEEVARALDTTSTTRLSAQDEPQLEAPIA